MAFNTNGAATAGPKGLFSIDPLDVRLQVKTKAQLNDIKAGAVYESIHVFCQEDKKFYTPKNYSTTGPNEYLTWEEVRYGGTWGTISGTLSDQTDLNAELTGLGGRIDDTEDDISDIQDTMDGYGDIVTHNAAEFQPAGDYATTSDLNDLADIVDGKQDNISDLGTIRSNAAAGAGAATTISGYGDIVTHNASEFATPGDIPTVPTVVSAFTNDAGYITANYHDSSKQDTITDLATIRSDAATGAGLATQVATNTENIEKLTVSKFPNVVIIGTPHIVGGQVSGYSDTNYLQFPFVDISRGQPFDIYFSFTTSDDITTQQNILDAHFGIALAIMNGKGIMSLSSNGTGWDIGTTTGTNELEPNTTYYVKYSWTGSQYTAALSKNEEEYVPDMTLNSTLSPYKTTIFIGGSPNIFGAGSAHPFKGTINFNDAKVVVGGTIVWQGMADVGLATRANVSLNNLDAVGEARFTAKQNVVTYNATTKTLQF